MFTGGYVKTRLSDDTIASYPLYTELSDLGNNPGFTVKVPNKIGAISDTFNIEVYYITCSVGTCGSMGDNNGYLGYRYIKVNKALSYDIYFKSDTESHILKLPAGSTSVYARDLAGPNLGAMNAACQDDSKSKCLMSGTLWLGTTKLTDIPYSSITVKSYTTDSNTATGATPIVVTVSIPGTTTLYAKCTNTTTKMAIFVNKAKKFLGLDHKSQSNGLCDNNYGCTSGDTPTKCADGSCSACVTLNSSCTTCDSYTCYLNQSCHACHSAAQTCTSSCHNGYKACGSCNVLCQSCYGSSQCGQTCTSGCYGTCYNTCYGACNGGNSCSPCDSGQSGSSSGCGTSCNGGNNCQTCNGCYGSGCYSANCGSCYGGCNLCDGGGQNDGGADNCPSNYGEGGTGTCGGCHGTCQGNNGSSGGGGGRSS